MAEQLLGKARAELALSREWKQFYQHLNELAEESLKSKLDQSSKQRVAVVKKLAKSVKDSDQYKQLQMKVPEVVQHHFSSSKSKKTKSKNETLDHASTSILLKWPQLRSQLKQFLLIPLPPQLRKVTWNAFLNDEVVRNEFLVTHQDIQPNKLLKNDPKLTERCRKVLQIGVFSELKKKENVLHAMCAVLKFWGKRSKEEITDSKIYLCIPFVYCYRDDLASLSETVNWSTLSKVAEMYISFIEMIPLSMKSVLHEPENAQALLSVCKQVEVLLTRADPKLMNHFNTATAKRRRQKGFRWTFHEQLCSLIHPFLQQMFVGNFSMETLCFILDQCFIFLDIPNSQFMPYCLTTWMLLHRRKLMNCNTVESVMDTLSNSADLTVEQFQKEIRTKFLSNIVEGTSIEVPTEEGKEESENYSLISRGTIEETKSHQKSKKEKGMHVDSDDNKERRRKKHLAKPIQIKAKALKATKIEDVVEVEEEEEGEEEEEEEEEKSDIESDEDTHTVRQKKATKSRKQQERQDKREMMHLKRQLSDLVSQQGKKTRASEAILKRERETHQSELQQMKREIMLLKETLTEKEEKINVLEKQTPIQENEEKTTTQALLLSNRKPTPVTSQIAQIPRLPSTLPELTRTERTIPSSVSQVVTSHSGERKFDPNSLTDSDVQEIFLTIFKRFKTAMYLICHGMDEERTKLIETLNSNDD